MIVRVANDGGDWRQLSPQLGVKYETANNWIIADAVHTKHSSKSGSTKKLTDGQINGISKFFFSLL